MDTLAPVPGDVHSTMYSHGSLYADADDSVMALDDGREFATLSADDEAPPRSLRTSRHSQQRTLNAKDWNEYQQAIAHSKGFEQFVDSPDYTSAPSSSIGLPERQRTDSGNRSFHSSPEEPSLSLSSSSSTSLNDLSLTIDPRTGGLSSRPSSARGDFGAVDALPTPGCSPVSSLEPSSESHHITASDDDPTIGRSAVNPVHAFTTESRSPESVATSAMAPVTPPSASTNYSTSAHKRPLIPFAYGKTASVHHGTQSSRASSYEDSQQHLQSGYGDPATHLHSQPTTPQVTLSPAFDPSAEDAEPFSIDTAVVLRYRISGSQSPANSTSLAAHTRDVQLVTRNDSIPSLPGSKVEQAGLQNAQHPRPASVASSIEDSGLRIGFSGNNETAGGRDPNTRLLFPATQNVDRDGGYRDPHSPAVSSESGRSNGSSHSAAVYSAGQAEAEGFGHQHAQGYVESAGHSADAYLQAEAAAQAGYVLSGTPETGYYYIHQSMIAPAGHPHPLEAHAVSQQYGHSAHNSREYVHYQPYASAVAAQAPSFRTNTSLEAPPLHRQSSSASSASYASVSTSSSASGYESAPAASGEGLVPSVPQRTVSTPDIAAWYESQSASEWSWHVDAGNGASTPEEAGKMASLRLASSPGEGSSMASGPSHLQQAPYQRASQPKYYRSASYNHPSHRHAGPYHLTDLLDGLEATSSVHPLAAARRSRRGTRSSSANKVPKPAFPSLASAGAPPLPTSGTSAVTLTKSKYGSSRLNAVYPNFRASYSTGSLPTQTAPKHEDSSVSPMLDEPSRQNSPNHTALESPEAPTAAASTSGFPTASDFAYTATEPVDPGSGIPLSMLPTKRSRGRRPVDSFDLELDVDIESTTAETDAQCDFAGLTKTGKPRKIFVCRVPGCGKCFRRSEHLKRHIRSIHTNDKPFPCTFNGCLKAFARGDNLKQHMKIVHGGIPDGQSDGERPTLSEGHSSDRGDGSPLQHMG